MTRDDGRRQRRAELVLEQLILTGSYKQAAAALGISEVTARRRVADYLEARGYLTWGQAAYYYGREDPEQLGAAG